MTLSSLYKELSTFLDENAVDDSALEARYIIQQLLNMDYSTFILRGNDLVDDVVIDKAFIMAERRVNGEPIQYILGEWDFMGLTFKVGEGVLIPRPETEMLCEYVLDKIKGISSPVIYDLCSGSGCIGISIKNIRPDAKVVLVEKSEKALSYLRENSKVLCKENEPDIIHGDILKFRDFHFLSEADVIISNPPYIKSDEILFLQKEVQMEPKMALDGGADGLLFYRALISDWSKKLKNDGFMALECGEDQSEDIRNLFLSIGFDSDVIFDYNNIQRIVIGRRAANVI